MQHTAVLGGKYVDLPASRILVIPIAGRHPFTIRAERHSAHAPGTAEGKGLFSILQIPDNAITTKRERAFSGSGRQGEIADPFVSRPEQFWLAELALAISCQRERI